MLISSITEAIGQTPLLKAERFSKAYDLNGEILAKLEGTNPAGSAKDRIAAKMVAVAEAEGKLKQGSVIIEPTSGNTGIGLAAIAAVRGYRAIFVMPDTMSVERQNLLKAYGAEVVLTPGAEGIKGSVEKAEDLAKGIKGAFMPSQFTNSANPQAHYETTGPEIWADTDGKVDIFIASVGTGGTLTGTAGFLKEKNPQIKIVAVEPASSPLLSKGYAGVHKIQGIGANFIPDTLDTKIYDEVIAVSNEDAFVYAREFSKREGYLVGISSGAVLAAAVQLLKRPENFGKQVAGVLTDSGERYLSTELFN